MAECVTSTYPRHRRFPSHLKVPEEWFDYEPFGEVIPETRIIAVKTPLKKEFNNGHPRQKDWANNFYDVGVCKEDEFTPQQLVDGLTAKGLRLSAVIDLTFTNRYYNSSEFKEMGVSHTKIKCPGKAVPSNEIYSRFADALRSSLRSTSEDPNTVVAVHCTHGVNRTGYLICRFLMKEKGLSFEEAIKYFQDARGHHIKKYLDALKDPSSQVHSLRTNKQDSPGPYRNRTHQEYLDYIPPDPPHRADIHPRHPHRSHDSQEPRKPYRPPPIREHAYNRDERNRYSESGQSLSWREHSPIDRPGVCVREYDERHFDHPPHEHGSHTYIRDKPYHYDDNHLEYQSNPYQYNHNPWDSGFQVPHKHCRNNPHRHKFHKEARGYN